ncbi:MAG: VacB/RNase II family 3'-5' exoribonuclease [Gammaproteobacteria bacterium]|nr:VacB/RNase II family 3'-5' exoribonuclease [Gammaproteobacteria bacterium]
MLNADALKQLATLKTDIRSSKEFAEGRVRGSNGKFGFVILNDGREAFLPPSEMERVFPGDRVKVSLSQESKGKLTAELDSLIESELNYILGQYVQRGQGHFIQPTQAGLSRWIFIPPKNRGNAQPGELIACTISRHPFKDSKPQARVSSVIGQADMVGIEHAFTLAQFQLDHKFSQPALAQAKAIPVQLQSLCESRTDVSELNFVTIDSPSTQDMDDALAISTCENGWTLHVAIADPSSTIEPGSPLDKVAQQRVSSIYLPGETLPMLPQALSEDAFSLHEGALRPALVMHIHIDNEGKLGESRYEFAALRSRHKLSYEQVSRFIEGDTQAVPAAQHQPLQELAKLSAVRTAYRANHAPLTPAQPEYRLILDSQRKLTRIEKQQRNLAQQMVEEAMLATNICAGEKLCALGQGCFSAHSGFRDERMGEIRSLLRETLPEFAELDFHHLDNYLRLVKHLENHPQTEIRNLLAILKRMLRPSQFSAAPTPHMGLGLNGYATITSPIRKFNDLHNHRVLRAAAEGQPIPTLNESTCSTLQQQLNNGRQANRALEQWLYCQYLQDQIGMSFSGKITLVNGAGIGVRLDDNGINGFVRLSGKKKQVKFDSKRLTLSRNDQQFQLEQSVQITISAVDIDKRRIAFALASN